jgi:hypothetical protein
VQVRDGRLQTVPCERRKDFNGGPLESQDRLAQVTQSFLRFSLERPVDASPNA